MKKIIILLFVLVLMLVFTACNKKIGVNNSETNQHSLSQKNEEMIIENITNDPQKNNTEKNVDNGSGGAVIELRKYRVCYYNIPAPFAALVGRDVSHQWEVEYGETHNVHLSDRMIIVDFIKDFDISKEDFEKANLSLAKNFLESEHKPMRNPLDHANQEVFEIYNADIIYTFNDEVINEYYISHNYPFLYEHEYEEAVANGTYQTQTTDWIDIEQMEAEIIAKYGETEIIPETATVPEEPAE